MYQVEVETRFSAAHALVIAGAREPMHGHTWCVRVVLEGEALDADGLLVDFHEVERALGEVIGRLDNRTLNDVEPFDRVNPSAELVARHIAEAVAASAPPRVRVASVRVTEAPGCAAVYRPEAGG